MILRQALILLLQDGYLIVAVALTGSFVYWIYENIAHWYVNRQYRRQGPK